MNDQFRIDHTVQDDLDLVFKLFDDSIAYQERKGAPVWKNYDREAIISDVRNGNQYKLIKEKQLALVFSLCYADRLIWREMENGDAVYLHRMVGNSSFKGQKLFGRVVEWVIEHAKERRLKYVRMDTWAKNPEIINYYLGFGFSAVGEFVTPDSHELPAHNRNLALMLLELKI